jgi:hypothetical protein
MDLGTMRITTTAVFTVSLIVIFSILLSNISSSITVEIPKDIKNDDEKVETLLKLDDSPRNVMHFLQVIN